MGIPGLKISDDGLYSEAREPGMSDGTNDGKRRRVRFSKPSDADVVWAFKLEEGNHHSDLLIASVGARRLAVRVVGTLASEDLVAATVRQLTEQN